MENAGLMVVDGNHTPVPLDYPIHFECKVVGEHYMGSHVMLFGEVTNIILHPALTKETPMEWNPWPQLMNLDGVT